MTDDAWERNAQWWIEGFTDGADPEYTEQILPLATQWLADAPRVLDIGTGDGQIARLVRAGGAELVVGVDPTAAQLRTARERAGDVAYVRGSAEHVPIRDASVDAVVACLVFEHLPDHVGPLHEVSRVLRPGGRFVFFLNHPLLQAPGSGWIDDHILEEQYWRVGAYLTVDVSMETLAPGVVLPFVHRPLSHYVNTMVDCGLVLQRMEEPAPPRGFLARASEYEDAATIPRLLLLVAERR